MEAKKTTNVVKIDSAKFYQKLQEAHMTRDMLCDRICKSKRSIGRYLDLGMPENIAELCCIFMKCDLDDILYVPVVEEAVTSEAVQQPVVVNTSLEMPEELSQTLEYQAKTLRGLGEVLDELLTVAKDTRNILMQIMKIDHGNAESVKTFQDEELRYRRYMNNNILAIAKKMGCYDEQQGKK